MPDRSHTSIDTKLIHAGEIRPRIAGAVAMPIFQSATFEFGGEASYHDIRYIRLNNTPNHAVLHAKLAALEGGQAALVAASGMAAISTTLLSVLRAGDHLLAQNCLYGGTHDFLTRDLANYGIEHSFIDGNDPDSWPAQLRPNTKALYMETLTNPLLEIADLVAAARFAHEYGLVSLIDNTFASPLNFRPIEHGFDLVLHSGTKYLNGHTDIVASAVVGSAERIEQIKWKLDHLGGALDPHACFLLHRGLKTLAVRVRHQNASAVRLARFLEGHDRVKRVLYPGLESHSEHARARELFDGFGGMLSFELDGDAAVADRFMANLELPVVAPSLGGVESLITRPATTSHVGIEPKQRMALGINDALLRLSVGLEAADDLSADFEQALRG